MKEKLLAIAPDEPQAFYVLRNAELIFGHFDAAEQYGKKLPDDWKDEWDAYLLWKQGKTGEAEKLFSSLEKDYEEGKSRYAAGYNPFIGSIFAMRGDKPNAYRYLNEAIEKGFVEYRLLEKAPLYENLRNDTEFQQIIAQLKRKVDEMSKRVKEQNL
jgi:hypothetical protein